MPENIEIEYAENLTHAEVSQLTTLEPTVRKALQIGLIFGRTRWTPKLDSSNRTILTLERANGKMLTFYSPCELARYGGDVERDILGKRNSYLDSLSDRPPFFEYLSQSQRSDIVNLRKNITVLVPISAANLGKISSIPRSQIMPTHVELPPTPAALTDSAAAQIIVYSSSDLKGAWQRVHIATYHEGGRIFFRDFDDQLLEAVFRFQ